MWSVFKLGLGYWARVEHLVDLPADEAVKHAQMLNLRFYPKFLYWAQRMPDNSAEGELAGNVADGADTGRS